MSQTQGPRSPQELARLLWELSRDGSQVLVRGPDARWRPARLPPARGSGSYLEVLAGGELRQWANDGSGRYRVLRRPSAHAHPTPPPGPTGCYLRRYTLGQSGLEACPTHDDGLADEAPEATPARGPGGSPGTCSSSR